MPDTIDVRSAVLVEPSEGDTTRVKPIFLKVRSQDVIPPSTDPVLSPWYNIVAGIYGSDPYLRPSSASYKYMMGTLSFTTVNGWYCEIRSDGRAKLSRTSPLTGTNSFFGASISGQEVTNNNIALPVPISKSYYTIVSSLLSDDTEIDTCAIHVIPNMGDVNNPAFGSISLKLDSRDVQLNGQYSTNYISIIVEGFVEFTADGLAALGCDAETIAELLGE